LSRRSFKIPVLALYSLASFPLKVFLEDALLQAVKKEMVAKMQMIGLSLERNMFRPPVRKKSSSTLRNVKKN
jgi:hypothetical protein